MYPYSCKKSTMLALFIQYSMYTDKAYLVKDRFHTTNDKSFSTLYRLPTVHGKGSLADPDLIPLSYGGKIIPQCPPGLENLYTLTKVYLIKRLEMFQNDLFNDYKGELIDEQGNRIFLITSAAYHFSDEVIHYGKHKAVKMKGKVNYGALNNSGIQLFEIHGDPERVIRIGPNSGLWGEIQVIPGDTWNGIHFNCCCIRIGRQSSAEAEVRVVVLKKDNRAFPEDEQQQGNMFKQVYTLRGKVSTGCREQSQQNFLYKKTFDLKIYVRDPFEPEKPPEKKADSDEEHSNEEDENDADEEHKVPRKPKHKIEPAVEVPQNTEPIGRICSQALHEKLKLHLPVVEFPQNISVYDKITLMGTFFLFNLKI